MIIFVVFGLKTTALKDCSKKWFIKCAGQIPCNILTASSLKKDSTAVWVGRPAVAVPTLQETGLGQAGSDSSLWTTHWLRTLGLRELAVVRTFQMSSHFFYFTWQPVWIWIIAFTYWTPPCHCPSTAPGAGMEKNKFYGNAFNKEKKQPQFHPLKKASEFLLN